jgi:hypothetical protein
MSGKLLMLLLKREIIPLNVRDFLPTSVKQFRKALFIFILFRQSV